MAAELADGTVEYRLYPTVLATDLDVSVNEHLQGHVDECMDVVGPLMRDYLWHGDPFSLQIADNRDIPHLVGRTEFKDNLEDEWFIVYLLYELTRTFTDTAATVTDSDGQFLLIEAADFIPKWLQPETSQNRVFISNGELHVIPIPQTPAQVTEFPTGTPLLSQALRLVKSSAMTRASRQVQTALNKRVGEYPAKAEEAVHFAHCYVPAGVALVLHYKPKLVAAAVQAFCERDPIDMKSISSMKHFPPDPSVLVTVKLTHYLYAMVAHQKFQAPRRWIQPRCRRANSKARDLGTKLTVGFEILCTRSEHRDESSPFMTPQWRRYVGSLKERGYFDGEMEGSKRYLELLEQAKTEFESTMSFCDTNCKDPGKAVLSVLSDYSLDEAVTRAELEKLVVESDESWLDITPEDLDRLLETRSGLKQTPSDECDTNGLDQLEAINTAVKSFVGKVSDLGGAEFPCGYDSRQVQFDGDSFVDALSEVLNSTHIVESEDGSETDEEENENDLLLSDVSDEESESAVPRLRDYMAQMDEELSVTEVAKTFANVGAQQEEGETADIQPVDIDLNLVSNILESFASQEGLAGPASNLLGSMGISIPQNTE